MTTYPWGAQPWGTLAAVPAVEDAVATFRFSDATYVTASDDADLPDVAFDARVLGVQFRQAATGGRLGGYASFDGGSLELGNGDRQLDGLARSYALAGRRVVVKVVGRRALDGGVYPYGAAKVLFDGYMGQPRIGRGQITIPLVGPERRYNVPVSSNRYAGTGDDEGGSDYEGKPKPVWIGQCFNVPAPQVNTADTMFQLTDGDVGSMQSIDVLRDNGVRQTKDTAIGTGGDFATYAALKAATIGTGKWATCLAEGWARMQAAPTGVVTFDGTGILGGTYVATPGAVARRLLQTVAGLATDQIEPAGFNSVDAVYPYPVGLWFGPEEEAGLADAMQILTDTVEGWWGPLPDGRIAMRLVQVPTGGWADEIGEGQIVEGFERGTLPAQVAPAVYRVNVGWQRAFYVHAAGFGGALHASDVGVINKAYRYAPAADTDVLSRYPDARSVVLGAGNERQETTRVVLTQVSAWATEAGAAAHAARFLPIYDGASAPMTVPLGPRGWLRRTGEKVAITLPSEDLDRRLGLVIGQSVDSGRGRGDIEVFGRVD